MSARHRSRKRALQVLFEWDMRKHPVEDAIGYYYETLRSEEDEKLPAPDEFMEALAKGTAAKVAEIDKLIEARAQNWRIERMAVVDRNILRLAIFELTEGTIPAPVVIDEALVLARHFSNDESLSFINGILDAVHKQTSV